PRAGKAGSCRPTRRPTSSTSSSNAPRQPWPRPTCSSVCVSPATRPSAARPLSSSSASRPTSRNLPRSSRKPIFLETCTSSRELGLFAAVCYPIATISKCLVHDLGGLIVRTMNKVPVSAERDAGRGVAKPAADHEDVHAGRDQHRGVCVAKRMQGDLRHSDCFHGAPPRRANRARALQLAVKSGQHRTVGGGLASAECKPLLLLRSPVGAQFHDDMRRYRYSAPAVLRLRPLNPDAVDGSLFECLFNPQTSSIEINV